MTTPDENVFPEDTPWTPTTWEGITTESRPQPDGVLIELRQSKLMPADSKWAGETVTRTCLCDRKAWQGHLTWYFQEHPAIGIGDRGMAEARHDATEAAMRYAGALYY